MTAAVYRSIRTLSVPPTQNTAPVLEFACLYTHDLRKKRKLWHDGVLHFHTFNKRAMVYDVPRNFIGDMHWTGGDDMQEGDEVVLEKAGVRVEVVERIGQTQTDLSELRAKKGAGANLELARRAEKGDLRAATPITRASSSGVARGNTQLKHKSLNALLGTPKGQMGKATLPTKSPFEERHANAENEEWEDGRPTKKARVAETPTSKDIPKQIDAPPCARTADIIADRQQHQHMGKVFIDLSDDVTPSHDFLPGFSSDALAPSSPERAAARNISSDSSSPTFQSRQSTTLSASVSAKDKPRGLRIQELDQEPEEEAGAAARRLSNARKSPHPARQPSIQPQRPPGTRPGQTLRLATSAPKKRMLFCQDQLAKKAQKKNPSSPESALDNILTVMENEDRPKTAKERIQDRLKQIYKRKARTATSGSTLAMTDDSMHSKAGDANDFGMRSGHIHREMRPSGEKSGSDDREQRSTAKVNSQRLTTNGVALLQASLQRQDGSLVLHDTFDSGTSSLREEFGQQSSHEASAIELARLDQMMLPPAAPRRGQTPSVPVASPRESRSLRRVISEPPQKPSPRNLADQAKSGSMRVPGAPVRYTPTPSPTKRSREPIPVPETEKEVRPPLKNKPKKNLQKSVSLNITAAGTSTVILGRPFQAPGKPKTTKPTKPDPSLEDVGPWSREAFDLFNWRPPGWDEEKWCVVGTIKGADKESTAPAGLSGGASLPSVLKESHKIA